MKHPVALSGKLVELVPLEPCHQEELVALSKDKRIWQYYLVDGGDTNTLIESLNTALIQREAGTQYPFVILKKEGNEIIGSTRFLDIQEEHKKLEIGWTWLHPDYWAAEINTECKFLLMSYCFETLGTVRVQLRTDENNIRSRKAIEKTGARFEGIIRNDLMKGNGTARNSAYYSVIDSEWEAVKQRFISRLSKDHSSG